MSGLSENGEVLIVHDWTSVFVLDGFVLEYKDLLSVCSCYWEATFL